MSFREAWSPNDLHFLYLQVDEIEALQIKCKQKVKSQSLRLKEISSQLKLAIAKEEAAVTANEKVRDITEFVYS